MRLLASCLLCIALPATSAAQHTSERIGALEAAAPVQSVPSVVVRTRLTPPGTPRGVRLVLAGADRPPTLRLVGGGLIGLAAGALGGALVGGGLGALLDAASGSTDGAFITLSQIGAGVGGTLGATVGPPVGVHLANGRRGRLLPGVFGSAAVLAGGALLLHVLDPNDFGEAAVVGGTLAAQQAVSIAIERGTTRR